MSGKEQLLYTDNVANDGCRHTRVKVCRLLYFPSASRWLITRLWSLYGTKWLWLCSAMCSSFSLVKKKNRQRERGGGGRCETANKQHHSEENLWSFITRLQQQQLKHVEANMQYRFFSSASTSSPLCFLSSSLPYMWLLTPYFTPAWPEPLTDCFIFSLMLSGMWQPFCGSPL